MKFNLEQLAMGLIGIGLAVIVISFTLFFWNEGASLSTSLKIDDSKFAGFGSFISGVVGTLWALAGVFLFYIALKEQRIDIGLNRKALQLQVKALEQQIEEFKLQTQELEETRKVFIDQSETQKLQQIDTEFSQIIFDINDIRYKGWLGIDALYNWDNEHGSNPNSVFNSLNYVLVRFSGYINRVDRSIEDTETRNYVLTRAYLMFHSKIIWPVLRSIYDDPAFIGHTDSVRNRLTELIGDTYMFFEGRTELETPTNSKIIKILEDRKIRNV